ncbi:MAG: DNA-processing protein DprA [Clostridia bacterium]|nr:DNA-processing protein DprA [Clostridia bacterium]
MKDRLFEIWFALRCGPQNREFQSLLELCGSPYDIYHAEEAELEKLPCSQSLRVRLADKSLEDATRIMRYCEENRVGILFWQDEQYPVSLRPLRDPPVLLYYQGTLPDFSRRLCISVVGTRSMSEYGKRMAYKIGYELAAAGTVVVSGMALGNDSVAAAGALAAGGRTVAVLGCGIDTVYPREHGQLAARIKRQGCVMTEFPPATPPESRNFPIRNRIISGLSQGTVVVEGDQRSGSMITARTAILQGRAIYAFPGNVGETNSAGTNQLIAGGAAMILSASDVLEDYTFLYRDALDMTKLRRAELCSETDDAFLAELGVATRTVKAQSKSGRRIGTSPRSSAHPDRSSDPKTATPSAVGKKDDKAPAPAPARTVTPAKGDLSEQILKQLTDTQRRIFELLPLDHAVTVDYLTREGFTVGEIMATMTILEIKGLTITLPGGLYSRK